MRNFRICTTTMQYSSKDADYGGTEFEQDDSLDIISFSKLVRKGYGFTSGIFSERFLGMADKSNRNMKSCSLIVLDIDGSCMTMDDCVSLIMEGYKPTFSYETMSNGEEGKGNRFRLVYLVSQEFPAEKYSAYAHALVDFIGIEQKCLDRRSFVQSQFWMGTKPSAKTISFNTTIELSWLEELSHAYYNNIYNLSYNEYIISYIKKKKKINDFGCPLYDNPKVYSSYLSRESDSAFISEWSGIIPEVYQSVVPDSGDEIMIDIPEDYYIVHTPWCGHGRKMRLHNGEGRRFFLFYNMVVRKRIMPSITPDMLLYGAVMDMEQYVSNNDMDDFINDREILNTVSQVHNMTICEIDRKYPTYGKDTRRRRKVSQAWCERNVCSKKAAHNIARGLDTDKKISRSYNPNLNDKDNAAAIGVSVKTLRRWREKYNIESSRKRSKSE